ncbi:MAG: tryptophan--tRNA ligase [Pseudomonadota bacterium]|nr:tryptophan--tRNA ligase [Pseudomonadota bacterium]
MSESSRRKPRVLSGVQPSGSLHIGNYLGALLQWRDLQDTYENFFCVVDLHALTVPENVKAAGLREKTLEVAALYLASGIDPARSTVFVQSEVAAHAELAWLLTCVSPLGWLQRMTQFKTKSDVASTVGAGLLTYPALMAADILLYEADQVPVGADQKQHIELARDVAARFNDMFGPTFKLPNPMIPPTGARVMGLDNPEQKMSKSISAPGHAIGLLDPPNVVKKAIMRAVTDTGSELVWAEASPGVKNLISIFAAITGESADAVAARYEGRGYGYLKKDLVDAVEGALLPLRARYTELRADPTYLNEVLDAGAERARSVAEPVLARAKAAAGLGRGR